MGNYEAMFIVHPELNEAKRKELFGQLNDTVTKNEGQIVSADIWSDKRKLSFVIKKFQEGIYYVINFKAPEASIAKLNQVYKLNENIIRMMITRLE